MPLTDDLGNRVRKLVKEELRYRIPSLFQLGQFEAWLSRIFEDQPDLTTSENIANRAIFER